MSFSILLPASLSAPRGTAIRWWCRPSRTRLISFCTCPAPISTTLLRSCWPRSSPASRPGPGARKVYFGNSGAEAVEAAFKLARWHTRRELNLAFFGAFHGRTMGALSLTASKTIQKKHYSPMVPGITHVPYPYCYRCPYHLCYPSCGTACVDWIEDTLFRTTMPPEEVAAIFVEPIQGEGGYIVPPPEFHQELYAIAQHYGILYVADEVQSGMGRTGKMFAMEHFGVAPDIMALAKGIASGLPLGAMLAWADIMDWEAGSHASTFGGNPVSCQAALATIQLLENGLMDNAARRGEQLMEGLRKIQQTIECLGDVRGKGLMVGVELVKDRATKERAGDWRDQVVQEAFRERLAAPWVWPEHHSLLPGPDRERGRNRRLPLDNLKRYFGSVP